MQGIDGSGAGLPQKMLELGEDLLDRIEVGTVRRQINELGTPSLDGCRTLRQRTAVGGCTSEQQTGLVSRRTWHVFVGPLTAVTNVICARLAEIDIVAHEN